MPMYGPIANPDENLFERRIVKMYSIDERGDERFDVKVNKCLAEGYEILRSGFKGAGSDYFKHWAHMVKWEIGKWIDGKWTTVEEMSK